MECMLKEKAEFLLAQHKVLLQFKQAHQKVFGEYEAMLSAIADTENDIKAYSRETKEELDTKMVKVKVISAWKKWYDFTLFSPKAKKVIEENEGVRYEVSREVVERLEKEEKISAKDTSKAFKREELTSRVSITVVLE